MMNVVLIIHIIITAALIGLVLIQKSEGGALGIGGGGGFMTTRGTANLLTRVTGILAALFFITTLSLAFLAKGEGRPKSILDEGGHVPTAPLPTPGAVPSGTQPVERESKKEAPASLDKESMAVDKKPAKETSAPLAAQTRSAEKKS